MFKRYIAPILLAAAAVVAGFSFDALAQTIPAGLRASYIPVFTGATATGTTTPVRNVNVPKSYVFSGATTAGSGSASITLEGANGNPAPTTSWVTVGTSTLTLGTVTTATTLSSTDRFTWLRGNVTAISGTGAAVSATAGF